MTATKTYANRSNARRAAKAAGLDLDTLVFSTVLDGTWTWAAAPVVAAPLAKPYRIRQGNPARVAARRAAAAAAAKAAAQPAPKAKRTRAAKASAPAASPTIPPHKEFALYGQSAVTSPVAYVHAWLNENGKGLTRKEALYALAQAGVNFATARTQYQRWFTANK